MLECPKCKNTVEILAHAVRREKDGTTFEAGLCLDCSDRYYQDQLTRDLIAAEKRAYLAFAKSELIAQLKVGA